MGEASSSKDQLREWVAQMAPSHVRELMQILGEDNHRLEKVRVEMAVEELRRLTDERGLSWDALSEEAREQFLDLLIREDVEATQGGPHPASLPPSAVCLQCGRDLTPHDLYRIYFSNRRPSNEFVVARIIVLDSDRADAQFPVLAESELLIGRLDPHRGIRPEVDLSAYDPAARVSRKHARISVRGGQFFIEDLGSANGTVINGRIRLKPQQVHALISGDLIRIGQTNLKFSTDHSPEQDPAKDS